MLQVPAVHADWPDQPESDDTGDSCYRYPLFMLAGLINLGLMVVMYKWTPDDGDMAFIFLAPICWGLSEGIWMTQTNCE